MASQWADLLQVYIKELVAIIHLDGVITEFTVADKFDFYCIFSEKKKTNYFICEVKQGKSKWVWKASKYLSENLQSCPQI